MPTPPNAMVTWNTATGIYHTGIPTEQGIIDDVDAAEGHPIPQPHPDDPFGNATLDQLIQAHAMMKKARKTPGKFDTSQSVSCTYNVPLLGGPSNHPDFVTSDVLLGVEIEVENWNGIGLDGWTHKEDHSLRNKGREFVAGPITPGQLQPRLTALLDMAIKGKWVANARTGIHVHMNVSNKPMGFLLSFVSCYLAAERTLFKYAGEWRRWCNFCHPLDEATEPLLALRDLLLEGKDMPDVFRQIGKYAGLNFASLTQYGTVEVRILPTTFDYQQITAWINVLLSIYATAEKLHEEGVTVSDYIKAYGTESLAGLLFFRHTSSVNEFTGVVELSDIRAALPRIKWLQTLSAVDWPLATNVEKLFFAKEVEKKDLSPVAAVAAKLRAVPFTAEMTKESIFQELDNEMTKALASDEGFSIFDLVTRGNENSASDLLAALEQNSPKFGAALASHFK
jgi:hypothetical protein